jgi:hypothetical protein
MVHPGWQELGEIIDCEKYENLSRIRLKKEVHIIHRKTSEKHPKYSPC